MVVQRLRRPTWVCAGLVLCGSFSMYLVVLLFATRVLFWLGDAWRPEHPLLRRLHAVVWGPSGDGEVGRLDRLLLGNGRRLRSRDRPRVLAMDLEFVRGALLLFANLTIYTNIKARIPMINSTVGDAWFEKLDHMLFTEVLIIAVERWFATSPAVAQYFADVYMHDYIWMVALVFVLYLRRDLFAFRWLIISVCVVYIVSVLVTVAYPSYGPCFLEAERFEWLRDTSVGHAQRGLAGFYRHSVQAVAAGQDVRAQAFVGIAAFPSLHVGHMVILLVVALRTVPIFALWMAWIAIATSIATVGFGWHYAVDAIGGIVIAAGITEGLYHVMKRSDPVSGAAVVKTAPGRP